MKKFKILSLSRLFTSFFKITMTNSTPSPQPLLEQQDPYAILANQMYINKQNRTIEKLANQIEKQNETREKCLDRCCCFIIFLIVFNVLGIIITICIL